QLVVGERSADRGRDRLTPKADYGNGAGQGVDGRGVPGEDAELAGGRYRLRGSDVGHLGFDRVADQVEGQRAGKGAIAGAVARAADGDGDNLRVLSRGHDRGRAEAGAHEHIAAGGGGRVVDDSSVVVLDDVDGDGGRPGDIAAQRDADVARTGP